MVKQTEAYIYIREKLNLSEEGNKKLDEILTKATARTDTKSP